MITIESNINFLIDYNAWRRSEHDNMPSPKDIGLNLDFAIEQLKKDVFKNKKAD